jgi:hypothetical protein
MKKNVAFWTIRWLFHFLFHAGSFLRQIYSLMFESAEAVAAITPALFLSSLRPSASPSCECFNVNAGADVQIPDARTKKG